MKPKGDSHFQHPGDLFAKLARNTDPEPSHEAGEAIFESGRMVTLQGDLVRLVRRYRGRTAREIQALYDGKGDLWKRVDGCVKNGLIYRGDDRRCRITGHLAATLYPVEK